MTDTKTPTVKLAAGDVPLMSELPRASSNVLGWAYLPGISPGLRACLWVRFKGGALYRYWSVPPILWEVLQVAPSIGGMLHEKVVGNPDYPCERVEVAG